MNFDLDEKEKRTLFSRQALLHFYSKSKKI
jgi:hypothetical protein